MRRPLLGLSLTSLGVLSSCGNFGTLDRLESPRNTVDCAIGSVGDSAPVISTQHSTATRPAATGLAAGQAILEGIYFRTGTTSYGQADDQPDSGVVQATAFVTDTTLEEVAHAFPAPVSRVRHTYVVSGTNLLLSIVCSTPDTSPAGQTAAHPFSYADGVLKLYDIDTMEERVYTRQ